MKKIKRIDQLQRNLQAQIPTFRCPHCQSPFAKLEAYSLYCTQNHSYNLNKKGYIHLMATNHKTIYDKELFTSRNLIYQAGIYEPFLTELTNQIKALNLKGTALDAGTGEGYFLNFLQQKLPDLTYIGLDIAKDGLSVAAQSELPIIWTLADLANLPLQDNTLDLILNILSPANYDEFQRTLKPEGYLLKIIPGKDYLKEIRTAIKGKLHSNDLVIQQFTNNFTLIHNTSITYPTPITPDLWKHLIRMTPMTSALTLEERELLEHAPAPNITIDLVFLIGKP